MFSKRNICNLAFAFLLLPSVAESAANSSATCFAEPLKDVFVSVPVRDVPEGGFELVDPHPPVPSIGNPIQEEAVDKLLASVPKSYQESYRFLVDEIRAGYIRFPEFRNALEETAKDFVASNTQLIAQNDFVVYALSNTAVKKSNRWCAELLMERKKELGLPNRVKLFEKPSALLEYLRKSGSRDVVIIDDASYSGSQLDQILWMFAMDENTLRSLGLEGLHFHIVVPYMSEPALKLVRARQKELSVRIYQHRKLSVLRDRIDLAVQEKRLSPTGADQVRSLLTMDGTRGLNFFEHKIPDEVSTVTFQAGTHPSVLELMLVPTSDAGTGTRKMPSVLREIQPPYRDKKY